VLRNTCVRSRAALTAMLCLCLSVPAVSQSLGNFVRGELKSNTPRALSDYTVQLMDPTHRESLYRAEVHGDGGFELRNLPPGEYIAIVTTLRGEVVTEQHLSVTPQGRLEIRMPDAPLNRPGARTVSVKQLLHPPTKKAFHSFVEAQKLSSSGDYAKAAQALERAVEESPDYAEAHVNLGVQYIRTGRLESAAAELNRAIEIAGPSAPTLCNLAWVQAHLGRPDEAMVNVRAALKLDQGSAQGHLIMGHLLASDPQSRREAIDHLKKAAATFPSAQRLIDQLR